MDSDPLAYRALLDSLPFPIWLTDPYGSCTFENRAALDFTGCKLEDVLGHGWRNHVHPEDAVRFARERVAPSAARSQWQIELRLRCANGEFRWFLATLFPLADPRGSFLGYAACSTDIH